FSSRRRHTRCYRDWSSDVCSSDLPPGLDAQAHVDERLDRAERLADALDLDHGVRRHLRPTGPATSHLPAEPLELAVQCHVALLRSEERRVGKSVDRRGPRKYTSKS